MTMTLPPEYIGNDMQRVTTLDHCQVVPKPPGIWWNVTIVGVREAILNHRVTSMIEDTGNNDLKLRSFAAAHDAMLQAVMNGRMFDLGYLPNEILISESKRAGALYAAGHIGHPFRQSYLLFHKWEMGGSLYLVNHDEQTRTMFTALEFQCISIPSGNYLILGDAVDIEAASINDKNDFRAQLYPSTARLHAMKMGFQETQAAAICNVVDPILACILLLATDGVRVQRIDASEKLNKARVKNRKPIIPPYWQVETKPYITALTTKAPRRQSDSAEHGHHRSPIPHLRRGHIRTLRSGTTTWVRDALVNLKDPNHPLTRSFYQMQQETENPK